jgi:hypothetical protein
MCYKNFGIGLIALSITLFLGITGSEFFKFSYIPEIEVVEVNNLTSENTVKNCEPIDKDLKSQILPFDEDEKYLKEIDGNGGIILVPVPTIKNNDKPVKDKQNSGESVKDAPMDLPNNLEEEIKELPIPLPEKQHTEYKNLLHKEICRENKNGRK